MTDEAGAELRRFIIGERLTPHVRHRQKYVDVPVSDSLAFVFGSDRPRLQLAPVPCVNSSKSSRTRPNTGRRIPAPRRLLTVDQ